MSIFSEHFDGIATLLTGLIVLVVYWLKKRNEKIAAAQIILLEIQNAERSIDVIKTTGAVSQLTFVLPTNNWYLYRHLFISDLDPNERDLLNNFYNGCSMIELEIQRMKNYLAISNEEKLRLTQHKLLDLAERFKDKGKEEYDLEKRKIFNKLFFPESDWFEPNVSKDRLRDFVPHITKITTSSCGQKLKRVAQTRKFQSLFT